MEKRIRNIQTSDAKAVRDIYEPYVSGTATSFEIEAPDVFAMEQRIRSLVGQFPWIVFEADGKVLGYAYASRHRERLAYQWCSDVALYVHHSVHRCGVGRALYKSLFEILRAQGYVNAYAGITLPNASSVGLHEAMGFSTVGVYAHIGYKFGRWHDVAWLHFRLLDPETPIPTPLPASQIVDAEYISDVFQKQAATIRYG